MNAIEVRGVTKTYRRYGRRKQFATLKSALLTGRVLRDLRPEETFDALRGVSFEVPAGSTFGIVGRNGSGKSTILKLIAGIGRPTEGTVVAQGRVSALIELGAGFHPEISGRENVFINGMMLGLTKREIAARFDEIVAFAEMEEFIDEPVKTYSSGMYMRLGFAVAIHVDPDVLLVDEVLAVGDEAFTHKCLDKFADFRRSGRTVLLVTHSLELVTRFCDQALWLDGGKVKVQGDPRRVVDAYLLDVAKTEETTLSRAALQAAGRSEGQPPQSSLSPSDVVPQSQSDGEPANAEADLPADTEGSGETSPKREREGAEVGPEVGAEVGPEVGAEVGAAPPDMFKATEGRWGSREVEIVGVDVLGAGDRPAHVFPSGEPLEIRLRVRANRPVTDLVFGVGIFNADGVCCYGTNTQIDGAVAGELRGDGEARFVVDRLDLVDGTYKLDVAVHRENGTPYDYHRLLYTIRVTSRSKEAGIFRLPHRWTFGGGVRMSGLNPSEATVPQGQMSLKDTGVRRPLPPNEAALFAKGVRARRETVVFTNGVFDLLHPGHVRYLRDARALGGALIVGVNSDRSVRANKGPTRPVNPEGERAEVLLALDSVDAVVIFDEDTPLAVIEQIQPDILVKGADWGPDSIVGRDVVEARGGRVVRLTLSPGFSSSALIERIRQLS